MRRLVAIVGLALGASLAPVDGWAQDVPLAEAARGEEVSILERVPDALPRAEPDVWKTWSSQDPVPPALKESSERLALALRSGSDLRVLEMLWELLELAPDYPPALHQAGVIYFRMRRYGDAATCFERFVEVMPSGLPDTRALGHAYYSLGRYERALEHYEAILAVRPKELEARHGRALALMRLGQPLEALEDLGAVLTQDRTHAAAATWRAQILYDEGHLEPALAAVERARELAPYDTRVWFLKSRIHVELEQMDESKTALERFQLLDRATQEIRRLEAKSLYGPPEPADEVRVFALLREIGDRRRARDQALKLRRGWPDSLPVQLAVLEGLEAMGERRAGDAHARHLSTAFEHEADCWAALRGYYSRTGDVQAALRAGERALRLGGER